MSKKIGFLFVMLVFFQSAFAQIGSITGKVTDDKGNPMPGVSVLIEGTTKGVATDFDGNYSIEAKKGDVLVFSYVGFTTLKKTVGGGNSLKINALLKEDAQQLSEVVVVGFGTQKKENLTGAVATVDSKALENRPVSNVVQALQGAVTGVNFSIGNGGGELDKTASINIRGAGTIGNTSSSPLILIDGMEGDLSSLSPQDIESISVLKDAASSSIYGSRAAFGVVLVKTKGGKEGKINVNYNQNYRLSTPLLRPKMLDSERFAYYWNDAARNAGIGDPFSEEILKNIIAYKKGEIAKNQTSTWNVARGNWVGYMGSWDNINWFNEFYRENAPSQEHNLSVRGGTDKVNFYFSANLLKQEGLLRYNTEDYSRKGITGRISAQLFKGIKMDYKTQFSRINYDRPFYASPLFYHNISRRWPTLPLYDPNGYYFEGNEIVQLEGGNSESVTDELIQQLTFTITPIKNWNTHIDLNYKTSNIFNHAHALPIYRHDKEGNPVLMPFNGLGLTKPGQTFVSEYGYKRNYFSPNIYSDYSFSLKDLHNFKVMVGFQAELNEYRDLSARREDLYTPNVLVINTTYGEKDDVAGQKQHWATAGFFSRLNYSYNNKYLLEVNARYDGTSRYLRDQRWNLFTSASLGWNLVYEDFWKNLGGFTEKIDILKPRISYGELGNQNIKNWYPFFLAMPVGANNGNWLLDGDKTNTASAPGIISNLLTWEKVSTVNYGIDLNMFDNRLSIVFDYFVRQTKGMVGPAPTLPATLGTEVPKYNNTDMESKGFELEVTWKDRLENGLGYQTRLTLTDSRQFVTNYPNETGSLGKERNDHYSGKELGNIWGYTTVGIAKSNEEMNAYLKEVNQDAMGSNWAAGDIMYADLNGDGKINNGANTLEDHGDLSIIGNSTPRYNFGLDLSADWKGIDFRMMFQGTMKRDLSVGGPYFIGANSNKWQNAGFEEHLDYFRPEDTKSPFGPNVNSYFPRPIENSGGKNFHTQTRWLQNGAYVRLKTIQLGYTIPRDITGMIGINKLRFYLSGENLWTYTKLIEIFDPETTGGAWGNGKIYPLSKVVSAGVNLTF